MEKRCKIVPHNAFMKIRGNDKLYEEALEASSKFNKQLAGERKTRIPFIDNQTRVAQTNSLIWYMEYQRTRGVRVGQLVSYPVRKWYKPRRRFLDPDLSSAPYRMTSSMSNNETSSIPPSLLGSHNLASSLNENSNSMDAYSTNTNSNYHHSASASSNLFKQSLSSTGDDHHKSNINSMNASGADEWQYHDDTLDNIDTNDETNSDGGGDDYEDPSSRRRKGGRKQTAAAGSNLSSSTTGRLARQKGKHTNTSASSAQDDDKPFVCERCGMKYKTKPGLSYHMHKAHANTSKPSEVINADENANSVFESVYDDMNSSSSMAQHAGQSNMSNTALVQQANANAGSNSATHLSTNSMSVQASAIVPKIPTGKHCASCLGTEQENRISQAEQFVTCCECTKNFHPSCLNFNEIMTNSIRKYNWQCVDCKHCTICGNSENDDKLLFCDGCDRGYHMYCLKPPFTEAPDGDWRCELCVKQLGPAIAQRTAS